MEIDLLKNLHVLRQATYLADGVAPQHSKVPRFFQISRFSIHTIRVSPLPLPLTQILRERLIAQHLQEFWKVPRKSRRIVHQPSPSRASLSPRTGCHSQGHQRRQHPHHQRRSSQTRGLWRRNQDQRTKRCRRRRKSLLEFVRAWCRLTIVAPEVIELTGATPASDIWSPSPPAHS
jgi:hypothetical protein